MEEAIKAIQETPVPTMLIVAGLFFILLGFISKLGGMLEVSPEQKRFTIPIGLLVLMIGLVLYFDPSLDSVSPGNISEAISTTEPTLSSPISNSLENRPSPSVDRTVQSTWQFIGISSLTGEGIFVDSSSIKKSADATDFTYRIKGEVLFAQADCSNNQWYVSTYDKTYSPLSQATQDMLSYVCR